MIENQIVDGWLQSARKCPSPHFSSLPGREISLLVIHCISLPAGQFGGKNIDLFFTGQLDPKADPYFQEIAHLKVAAHLLINREGQVTQYVSFHDVAYHAGESIFKGRPRCNDFSIGIELEGTDDTEYTQVQYLKLIEITKVLRREWPAITSDRIVGHSDISPGRKADPGPFFQWSFYKNNL